VHTTARNVRKGSNLPLLRWARESLQSAVRRSDKRRCGAG
jgi:hypothetical protein